MDIRDLTHPVSGETSVPSGLPTFHQGRCVKHEESGYESDYLISTIHVGTHIDAPYHYDPDGRKIGDIDLSELIRPTKYVDVREHTEPGRGIRLSEISEKLSSPLEEGEYLFVYTGWAEEHLTDRHYYNENPYLSTAISEYIVEQKGQGIILDTPIDEDTEYRNHYKLLENDKIIVEHVVNAEALPPEFTTFITPMNIKNGDGAPARVFIIQEES